MMKKGFLSVVLASVFLLAIAAGAARFSSMQPDSSYQKYQMVHLQELAIKRAFYDSTAKVASDAYAAAVADGMPPRQAVEAAVAANAILFEEPLSSLGYEVSFWCGPAGASSRQQASAGMAGQKRALPPAQTLPLAACAGAFQADVHFRKLHLASLGFSHYSQESGIGYATVLPPSYEVDF
jgi:hypothetical protein